MAPPKFDDPRDAVIDIICKEIKPTGQPCDLEKKPSEIPWDAQFWLDMAVECAIIVLNRSEKKIREDKKFMGKANDYHTEKLSKFCDYLVDLLKKNNPTS